jgi:hypothetical protein
MANTTPKPEDPKKEDPKPDDVAQAAPAEDNSPAARRARLDLLRQQLAAAEALNAQDGDEPPPPDKVLLLANGTTVETSGAVPSHYSPEGWKYAPLRVLDVLPLEA